MRFRLVWGSALASKHPHGVTHLQLESHLFFFLISYGHYKNPTGVDLQWSTATTESHHHGMLPYQTNWTCWSSAMVLSQRLPNPMQLGMYWCNSISSSRVQVTAWFHVKDYPGLYLKLTGSQVETQSYHLSWVDTGGTRWSSWALSVYWWHQSGRQHGRRSVWEGEKSNLDSHETGFAVKQNKAIGHAQEIQFLGIK